MNRRNWIKTVAGGAAAAVLAPKVKAVPAMGSVEDFVRDVENGAALGKSYDFQKRIADVAHVDNAVIVNCKIYNVPLAGAIVVGRGPNFIASNVITTAPM